MADALVMTDAQREALEEFAFEIFVGASNREEAVLAMAGGTLAFTIVWDIPREQHEQITGFVANEVSSLHDQLARGDPDLTIKMLLSKVRGK